MTALEICIDDAAGLRAAQEAGVTRIELCAALGAGGLTPSPGLMRLAATGTVRAYAMIRPRIGDFVFNAGDEAAMLADIAAAREAGLAGLVLGASLPDGRLDAPLLARLCAASGPLGRTLHRAFDLVPDPIAALETAIGLGFERILTSGGAITAPQGADRLRALVQSARGRIEIMAGSGVTPANALALVRKTGVTALHASCRGTPVASPASVAALGFGALRATTDAATIRKLLAALAQKDT